MDSFEFGIEMSDIRQLPWPNVKFNGDYLNIFYFTLPFLKVLLQDG